MNIRRLNPEEALAELLEQKGPFVSLYLPYGVPGKDEPTMNIERKNVLSQAREKLNGSTSDHMARVMKEIETDLQSLELNGDQDSPDLPYTRIYFAAPDFAIKTALPSVLRSHFSFAPFAELEPLVYSHWVHEPFWVVSISNHEFRIKHGSGSQFGEVDPIIPQAQQNSFGTTIEDFSFDNVIAIADKNRDPGSDLDQRRGNVIHGFTSRQSTKQERNQSFWIQVIAAICRETIMQKPGEVFFVGSDNLVRKLSTVLAKNLSREFFFLKPSDAGDDRTLLHSIQCIIANRKLETADKEFQEAVYQENINEVVELVESGRTRKLYVQQDDWFIERNVTNDIYEVSNPRAVILAKALKNRTAVEYTRSRINNKHGLAAQAY